MTREMRKKYAPVPDSVGRLRRPAGGRDIIYLCDVIDELECIVREVEGNLPLNARIIKITDCKTCPYFLDSPLVSESMAWCQDCKQYFTYIPGQVPGCCCLDLADAARNNER